MDVVAGKVRVGPQRSRIELANTFETERRPGARSQIRRLLRRPGAQHEVRRRVPVAEVAHVDRFVPLGQVVVLIGHLHIDRCAPPRDLRPRPERLTVLHEPFGTVAHQSREKPEPLGPFEIASIRERVDHRARLRDDQAEVLPRFAASQSRCRGLLDLAIWLGHVRTHFATCSLREVMMVSFAARSRGAKVERHCRRGSSRARRRWGYRRSPSHC